MSRREYEKVNNGHYSGIIYNILYTYKCSAASVSRCLSFPFGILWSITIVSVLAKQKPLDRIISVGGKKERKR